MANLEVELIYLYPRENATNHHTDKFELTLDEDMPTPVLRRGQNFTMALGFSGQDYDEKSDSIRLIFNYGPNPNGVKGTKGIIDISPNTKELDDKFWSGKILAGGSNSLTLEVYCPSTAPVGVWKLEISTSKIQSDKASSSFPYENDIYILFNPWICHDHVYMPDKRLLEEYVLQDVGKIWIGPWGSCKGREWVFGQFDAVVLPAVMFMFERATLPHASRGDPIKVARMISKMVNSNDDFGVLTGRWDGNYSDGTSPSAWTGSTAILEEYLENEMPVNYGQCWVFSGVVTTICRALGIPSRVVSNLVSAHDANATLTVDKYFDANGEEIEDDPNNPMGSDSVWNYHVWNDVWMARPDLPNGYGGWQAIDATPQETSSGFFQCGPASLEAIKKGEVGYNFDVAFMVASVNADLMRWKEDSSNVLGYKRIYCNKYHIGRMILTKKPFIWDPNGDRDREDITLQYKPKEGTQTERISLYNAVRGTETAKKFFSMPAKESEDVEFDLKELEKINIGDDFAVEVEIVNKSNGVRHISAMLSSKSIYYTGVKASLIEKSQGNFVMKPHAKEKLKMTVKADKYLDKLVEYGMIKLYAMANVKETNQTWAEEDDFQVQNPTINFKVPEKVYLKQPITIQLCFTNSLEKTLTNCKIRVHGPSLVRNFIITHPDVKPHQEMKAETTITPTNLGEQILVATFNSDELHNVTGSIKVNVV